MSSERQFSPLGKLQTPVEFNDSAGPGPDPVPLKSMEISSLLPPLETASDETPDPVVHPAVPPVMPPVLAHVTAPVTPTMLEPSTPVRNPVIPRRRNVKLGYLGIDIDPEQAKPPEVYGKINGHPARILLDTGCSTYVLSSDFAKACNIPNFPSKPIPVELAI
jgi:hypothetical protein